MVHGIIAEELEKAEGGKEEHIGRRFFCEKEPPASLKIFLDVKTVGFVADDDDAKKDGCVEEAKNVAADARELLENLLAAGLN